MHRTVDAIVVTRSIPVILLIPSVLFSRAGPAVSFVHWFSSQRGVNMYHFTMMYVLDTIVMSMGANFDASEIVLKMPVGYLSTV